MNIVLEWSPDQEMLKKKKMFLKWEKKNLSSFFPLLFLTHSLSVLKPNLTEPEIYAESIFPAGNALFKITKGFSVYYTMEMKWMT